MEVVLLHVRTYILLSLCYYDVRIFIAGVDYESVNVRLTYTSTLQSQIVNVMTIDDDIFEDDERICLRLTNLIEPCPGSVILGDDTEVVIAEDESKFNLLLCVYT